MRILHVQKSSGVGGSERYLLSLLPALRAEGADVHMVVLATGDYRRFVEPLNDAGVDTTVVQAGWDLNPALVWKIRREIARFRPDLVHTHLIHGDIYGQTAAKLSGLPGVSTYHGTHPFYRRVPYRNAARTAGGMSARVIAVSRHVARFLAEVGIADEASIRVIPIGVDVEEWPPTALDENAYRSRLGVTEGEVAIGIASRLIPLKGHGFLFDALAAAIRRSPNMKLFIAGDGPLRAELEMRAGYRFHEETVRFLGFLDDVEPFIAACDVVVFPTLPGFGEGFGLSALEAMAAGRPVVAAAVDSLPEIVTDEETGLLVAPGRADELADALVRLATDRGLREKMGRSARDRAERDFSLGKMVRETVAIYQEVLATPRREDRSAAP